MSLLADGKGLFASYTVHSSLPCSGSKDRRKMPGLISTVLSPRISTRNISKERIFLSCKQCTFLPESTPLHGHRIIDRLQPHVRTGQSMCAIFTSQKWIPYPSLRVKQEEERRD